MRDLCAIVPVKPLDTAKGRLAGMLAPAERRRLVLTMLGDVLQVLAQERMIAQTFVVTADTDVAQVAVARGLQAIAEPAATGLNAGVEAGLAATARMRFGRALV